MFGSVHDAFVHSSEQVATLDIDRTFVHWDNQHANVEKLLAENKGKVVLDQTGAR